MGQETMQTAVGVRVGERMTDRVEGDVDAKSDIDVLHEIGSRIAAADPMHAVLGRVVDFVSSLVQCDSCFVYVLEDDELVLRASKTPHPDVVDRLKMQIGRASCRESRENVV